ncbi:MAG: FAD:protein FMN transferase [Candidatus Nitrosoglobus sp.]
MGTSYSIKIADLPAAIDSKILDRNIAQLLAEINGLMSTYQEDSELSCFNRSRSTHWIAVSSELVKVLAEAQKISRLSGGAFDVTVGSLVNLWGFGPSQHTDKIPSLRQVEAEKEKVNFKLLKVRNLPPALKKQRGDIYVDLSAIAKGYGVDRVAELLESQGIYNYLVDIGGEERIKGYGPEGIPWRIAIEQPVTGERKVERILELTAGALATSGDYRNYFEQNGKRYSHIIVPSTGWPITHKLASVTVLTAMAMHADALATALLVLGPEQGFQLAEREQIAALFLIKTPEGFMEKATTGLMEIHSRTVSANAP